MSRRPIGFASMLGITMAMSTFSLFALAVTASDLEAEFDISKFQLGLIGAVNTGVGGLTAPMAGRATDLLGGRRAMGGVLLLSGVGSALAALSNSYGLLLAAMALSGIPQGWGNPACNKAIANGIAPENRGIITGVKQSGVQLATFSSGFAMPTIASMWGWRAGLWLAAGVSLVAMLGLRAVTELDDATHRQAKIDDAARSRSIPPIVYQITVFGFLLGLVGGGLGRFLPLFAEEEVGFSAAQAGLVFGISGLVAIPSRITWGAILDRGFSTQRALVMMGAGAVVSCLVLLGASNGAGLFLWIGTILSGLTVGSWNTAANLAMIQESGPGGAGRSTGILLSGFLIGLTIGGPAVGASIDAFGDYEPAWIASAIACALGTAAVARRLGQPRRYS